MEPRKVNDKSEAVEAQFHYCNRCGGRIRSRKATKSGLCKSCRALTDQSVAMKGWTCDHRIEGLMCGWPNRPTDTHCRMCGHSH